MLQASLTRAKYEKKIELDLLLRVSLIKFLTQEIGTQFATLLLEAKEWIRSRGEYFERSEQAHVMKARLAELQADRRNIFRQVGQHVYQILARSRKTIWAAARQALFRRRAERRLRDAGRPHGLCGRRPGRRALPRQYVLLGNYLAGRGPLRDLRCLVLDFLRETHSGSPAAGRARCTRPRWRIRNWFDSALAAREELARLEEQRNALARQVRTGGGMLARVGIGADTGRAARGR